MECREPFTTPPPPHVCGPHPHQSSVITLNPATCGHLKTGHLSRSKDDSFDQPPSFQATSVAGGGFRVFALNSIVKHGGGRPLDHESRRRPASFARHPYRLGICHKWPVFKRTP